MDEIKNACEVLLKGGCSTLGVGAKALHEAMSGSKQDYPAGDAYFHAPNMGKALEAVLKAVRDQPEYPFN